MLRGLFLLLLAWSLVGTGHAQDTRRIAPPLPLERLQAYPSEEIPFARRVRLLGAGLAMMALGNLALGLFSGPVLDLAQRWALAFA